MEALRGTSGANTLCTGPTQNDTIGEQKEINVLEIWKIFQRLAMFPYPRVVSHTQSWLLALK